MLIDANGQFVTQREQSRLSLVDTTLEGESLKLAAPGLEPLALPLRHESGALRAVQIWLDEALGAVHAQGSAWFSAYLGAPHQLVYMPDAHRRQVNPSRAKAGDIVAFADGYPFLVISEASLADLNARLETPLSMQRFRPNIVIGGTQPFAEDSYAQVRIGEISFRGPKRCERCVITTIDPETGEQGKEPLRTLSHYRREDGKVWFGMNLIHDNLGVLRVGDRVVLTA